MKIVTGYTGTPHITSNDDQARNQGIFGKGNYVLDVGNKLNATLNNATTVTLSDGDGVMQGVHFRIEPGMTETVSISPGTTGYNRIDLICARYTKEISTGIEDVSLVVIEGTPTTGSPTAPTFTNEDIVAGGTLAHMPIWRVTLSGLTPAITRAAPSDVGSGYWLIEGIAVNVGVDTVESIDVDDERLNTDQYIVVGAMQANYRYEYPDDLNWKSGLVRANDSSSGRVYPKVIIACDTTVAPGIPRYIHIEVYNNEVVREHIKYRVLLKKIS